MDERDYCGCRRCDADRALEQRIDGHREREAHAAEGRQ